MIVGDDKKLAVKINSNGKKDDVRKRERKRNIAALRRKKKCCALIWHLKFMRCIDSLKRVRRAKLNIWIICDKRGSAGE